MRGFILFIGLLIFPLSFTEAQIPIPLLETVSSDTLTQASELDTLNVDDIEEELGSSDPETAKTGEREIRRPADIPDIPNLFSFTKIFISFIILLITWAFNRLLIGILDNVSEKSTDYRLFIKRLVPIVRISLWSAGIYIVIAGIINPPFETVLAISASIGIAVGFASQDILRNIFGGIMIILDKPFQVGDKIQVGDHYGEVKSIGLRSSLLVTPDDSVVSIPNGELMNRAVSNANSSALDCQCVAEIFIPINSDIELAKDIARRAVYSSPYVYLNKPVVVIALNEMHQNRPMVKLRVKGYVLDIRYEFLFISDMTEIILGEFNKKRILGELVETAETTPES